jgi:AcrR family transcriptional regulator
MSTSARPGPRERLLRAARDLTYAHGVGVGVDTILRESDVARRSLYQHFGGKDGLIAEVLRTAEDEQRYRAALDAGGDDPRQRVLAVFDTLDEIVSRPGFHGCRYMAAELSITDPGHPAHAEIRAFKWRLHELFTHELDRLGHPSPAFGADQLLVLVDGVLSHAVVRPEARPARAARALAEHVLDA